MENIENDTPTNPTEDNTNPAPFESEQKMQKITAGVSQIKDELRKVIVGQEELIEAQGKIADAFKRYGIYESK